MNYIKYLADARLINMMYNPGDSFPKKPAKIMLHNTNLVYSIYPLKIEDQDVLETFMANSLWKDHKVSKGGKGLSFVVDGNIQMRVCTDSSRVKNRNNPNVYHVMQKRELGRGNEIPLSGSSDSYINIGMRCHPEHREGSRTGTLQDTLRVSSFHSE